MWTSYKTVTYNNAAPNAEQLEELAGTYTFTVYTDESCQHPYMEDDVAKTISVVIDDTAQVTSEVIALPKGTYWIKEETPENGSIPVQNGIRVVIDDQSTTTSPAIVSFTNNYNHGGPDEVILDIRKTFTGLSSADKIPEGYYVKIKYKVDGVEKSVELHNRSEGNVEFVGSNDGLVWSWKVGGIPTNATDFTIQEFNTTASGYQPVVTTLNGTPVNLTDEEQPAQVQMPTVTLTEVDPDIYSPDNEKAFPIDDNTIFLTRLTGSNAQSAGHTLVISNQILTFRERAAVEAVIRGFTGNWVTPADFYSIENNETTFYYKGKTIDVVNAPFYDKHGNLKETPYTQAVKFSDTNQWTHTATYSMTVDYHETDNAFEIVNAYEDTPVDIRIVKVDKDHRETKLPGAAFTITKLDESTTPEHVVFAMIPAGGGQEERFELQMVSDETDSNGKTGFTGLPAGYYQIKETKMPAGYVATSDGTFYVKVADGVATYLAVSTVPGTQIGSWAPITQTPEGAVVQVTPGSADNPETTGTDETAATEFEVGNTPGTELPAAGGRGTVGMMLTGAALLVAGAVALLRRRAVLGW